MHIFRCLIDCEAVLLFSPNQRTTQVRGGDWCEMRGRAGEGLEREKSLFSSPSPTRPRISPVPSAHPGRSLPG